MGLLMGALAGAAGAVERTTEYALRSMMDEEKSKRIAEYTSRLKSDEDLTTRARNKDDAAAERTRVAEFAKPAISQPNGLLSAGAGLDDPAAVGADENVGRDVQKRERAVSYKEAAGRAAQAGDLASASKFEGFDNQDEKIKMAQVVAEMRQKYNTDRLTQQGQVAMMRLAASIAKGENGGKLPADAQMIEYLVKEGIVQDKKAGAEWVKQGKRSDSDTEQTTTEHGEQTKQVVTRKIPSGQHPAPASSRASQFKVLR